MAALFWTAVIAEAAIPLILKEGKETAFIQLMAELKPRWEVLRKEFE